MVILLVFIAFFTVGMAAVGAINLLSRHG